MFNPFLGSVFGYWTPVTISTDAVIYVFRSLKKATRQKGKTIRKIKNNEMFILVTDLVPEIRQYGVKDKLIKTFLCYFQR